jgi:hypothetical protein
MFIGGGPRRSPTRSRHRCWNGVGRPGVIDATSSYKEAERDSLLPHRGCLACE